MESLLIVQLLHGLLANGIKTDKLLEGVGEEGGLFPGLGVFIPDDCLCHEVVKVVLLLQLAVVDLRVQVVRLAVVQLLGQLGGILIEVHIGVLTADESLIGPNHIFPVYTGCQLLLHVLNHMLCCLVLAQQDVDLSSDRVLVLVAEIIDAGFGPLLLVS